MRVSALFVGLGLAIVLSAPAAARSKADLRAQIEAFVDERGLPEGVDRVCVIDRAIKEYPKVKMNIVGTPPPGPMGAEFIQRAKVGGAVITAIEACSPAAPEGK